MQYGWNVLGDMKLKDIEDYVRKKKLEQLNKIK